MINKVPMAHLPQKSKSTCGAPIREMGAPFPDGYPAPAPGVVRTGGLSPLT